MGTQPIVSPDNFTDQATFKSAVRAEGDLQNPMMSKIFNLINDIDSYLQQNTGRQIEIKPTEENEDGGIELKVKNNDHPRIGNNMSDFETPNFNSRVMRSSGFYKNLQAIND